MSSATSQRNHTVQGLLQRLEVAGQLLRDQSYGIDQGELIISAACTHDSRRVDTGGIFVAIAGQRADGAAFAAEALQRGAAVLIGELEAVRSMEVLRAAHPKVQIIAVRNARRALAEASAWWEADPAESLVVIGVTGTDGKTTTSTYAAACWWTANGHCGTSDHAGGASPAGATAGDRCSG